MSNTRYTEEEKEQIAINLACRGGILSKQCWENIAIEVFLHYSSHPINEHADKDSVPMRNGNQIYCLVWRGGVDKYLLDFSGETGKQWLETCKCPAKPGSNEQLGLFINALKAANLELNNGKVIFHQNYPYNSPNNFFVGQRCDDDEVWEAHEIVGKRIAVFWGDDNCYYQGVVNRYDWANNSYLINYDDGQVEWRNFQRNKDKIKVFSN